MAICSDTKFIKANNYILLQNLWNTTICSNTKNILHLEFNTSLHFLINFPFYFSLCSSSYLLAIRPSLPFKLRWNESQICRLFANIFLIEFICKPMWSTIWPYDCILSSTTSFMLSFGIIMRLLHIHPNKCLYSQWTK